MIYDSYAWKQELRLWKRQLIKYNSKSAFDKNFDRSFHKVESAIFYSAFVIRKLVECEKLSDTADNYTLQIKSYKPVKNINRLHNLCDMDEYDWETYDLITMQGKHICNQLIHSYVSQLCFNEENAALGFFVSSDYERNNRLIEVSIEDWKKYMTVIMNDDVVEIKMHYDDKKRDYIATEKVRGNY